MIEQSLTGFLFPAVESVIILRKTDGTPQPLGDRRKHLGCAVYQDMIYAVGGRDDTTELSSAERYNPRSNQWSPVVAMTSHAVVGKCLAPWKLKKQAPKRGGLCRSLI